MNTLNNSNIPDELIQKIVDALNNNVEPLGKSIAFNQLDHLNDQLYEFCFYVMGENGELTDDYYNLMRSIDLADNESPDEFDLVYYDRDSILHYMSNFATMSDSFLVDLQDQYRVLSNLFQSTFGFPNPTKMPETLSDLIDSMYYDGDNYYLRTIIGYDDNSEKIMIIVDPMLNIETQSFFFRHRYYIGNQRFESFDSLISGFISKFMFKPVDDEREELFKQLNKEDSQ